MIDNKLPFSKITLFVIALLVLGTIVFIIFKKSSPVAVQPTPSPTSTPTPFSTPTPTPATTIMPTPNIDISDWKIYRNEKYGYELRYPKNYQSNKGYSIWTLTDEGDILNEWGVNKGQETVFSVDVYSKADKTKELAYYGKEVVGSGDIIINNVVAKKLDGGQSSWNNLMIENENYIYIIISSFFPSHLPQYNEYEAILSTFKFIK